MDTFIDGSTGDDELYNSPEYQVARSHFDDLDKIVVDYIILEIIEHSLTIIDEFADLLYGIYEDWTRGVEPMTFLKSGFGTGMRTTSTRSVRNGKIFFMRNTSVALLG